MKMPEKIGLVHFIGIGGIGMSGIAEVLHNLGYDVQGSDMSDSANVKRLREKGIAVHIGHRAENLGDAEVIVASTAIKQDNPERVAARERNLPMVRRAEMLAELMRFKKAIAIGGTHGKTTTTTMVSTLLVAGGLDPTVINGGIINDIGTNARMGDGEWMVVEADESDGTFLKLPADVAIVTNIDPEHLDHYGDYEAVKKAFTTFVENVPFYGFGVMCLDHPEVQAQVAKITDRRVVTYGENKQAEVRFVDVVSRGAASHFSIEKRDRKTGEITRIEDLVLPMPGLYNVSNATAAIAVSLELVLSAARQASSGKVIAIKQPHRYSRLESLFGDFCACFNDADHVLVAPVYEAGEKPIDGINSVTLAEGLRSGGHRSAIAINGPEAIAAKVAELAEPGDFVIFLGAGNVSQWAYALPDELKALG